MRTLTLDVFIASHRIMGNEREVRYWPRLLSLRDGPEFLIRPNRPNKKETPLTPTAARAEAIKAVMMELLHARSELLDKYAREEPRDKEKLLELVANSIFCFEGSELVRVGRNFTFKKKLGGKLISIRMRFFHWRMGKPAPNDLLTVAGMVAQKRFQSGIYHPRW